MVEYNSGGGPLIRQGDVCIIFISESQKYALKIEADKEIQTKFGLIRATDLIDQPYGKKFNLKRGWVIPLKLTPELWTQVLPHRTQVLYQADISMILLQLDIKPGSVVLESGTGSGSLSHAIVRACKPNGFLHTYDINESRVKEARHEFEEHGLGNNVKVLQRDVCNLGYGDELIDKVDACILDLPQTWAAIEHAYKTLKLNGSRLCTFSPCIEQVKQNVAKMTELKMKDIVTLETVLRPLEVREQTLRNWNEDILEGLTSIDKIRLENMKDSMNFKKRIRLDCVANVGVDSTKSMKEDDGDELVEDSPSNECKDPASRLQRVLNDPKAAFHPNMLPKTSKLFAKQWNETACHTGYLTFATKRL